MIEKIGMRLGEYFFNKGYIYEEDVDAVRYYVEVFFIAIRKYFGGYNAKTILRCNLISYLFYFSELLLNQLLSINFIIPLLLASFLYLWIKESIYSMNQIEFKYRDKQTDKLKIILITLLVLIVLYKKGQYLGLLTLVMFQVVLINIVKEREMNHENC